MIEQDQTAADTAHLQGHDAHNGRHKLCLRMCRFGKASACAQYAACCALASLNYSQVLRCLLQGTTVFKEKLSALACDSTMCTAVASYWLQQMHTTKCCIGMHFITWYAADIEPMSAAWLLQHRWHPPVQVLCRAVSGSSAHARWCDEQLQALGAGNSYGGPPKLSHLGLWQCVAYCFYCLSSC